MEQQKLICPNHPTKESSFYCFDHKTLACLRCVSLHIECQLENKFLPLEEIFESAQNEVTIEREVLSNNLKDYTTKLQDNSDKLGSLQGLKESDVQGIKDFFEEVKKKAEEMKLKALEKYEANFSSIVTKLNLNNSSIADSFNRESLQLARLEEIQEDLKKLNDIKEKKEKAVELKQKLEEIQKEAAFGKGVVHKMNNELESLMSQEEVFSEIGNLTLKYSSINSKVVEFMNEHMPEYANEADAVAKARENIEKNNKGDNGSETIEEMLKKIEYMKDENQVYEDNFLKVFEEVNNGEGEVQARENTRLHQLRFCSNEVNVFDCGTWKFTCYQLFTTKSYKTPFYIYNNCGSALYRNHLVFLFGGEDPVLYDKSSNRVFCFNLDQATVENKVVVYEISQMANARQEFALTTIGSSIYIISGYDSNRPKQDRVIGKCERLDIKSKKFTDVRDINYPRHAASSVNVNNTHIYVFGGENPKYLDYFVDKIERYTLNLNDWSVIKYSVMNEFTYEAGIYATAFRVNPTEIIILGGQREGEVLNGYYVFDMKKLLFVKKGENFLKEADNFYNQNDVLVDKKDRVQVFSGTKANYIYEIGVGEESYSLAVNVIKSQEISYDH